MQVEAVVFDVGNVLIRWDPRFLYRRLFADDVAMETFLAQVCTSAWNLEQDRGRTWDEAVAERCRQFPDQADLIRAFDTHWGEMVPGPVPGTADLLAELQQEGVPTHAITNFSREKWPIALARFPFLASFGVTVVSGDEGLVKPDPAIYRLLLERTGLAAGACLFIDDTPANVAAARDVGMRAHAFVDAATLRADLWALGLPVRPPAQAV